MPAQAALALPGDAATSVDRRDPAVRKRLTGPALHGFFAATDRWRLTNEQRRNLLGYPAASTYFHWKKGAHNVLSVDQLERVSLVLGIYKALRLIFADDATGDAWLTAANTDPVFGGRSPLERMLGGSIDDLYAVRRYLDAWRGGWG